MKMRAATKEILNKIYFAYAEDEFSMRDALAYCKKAGIDNAGPAINNYATRVSRGRYVLDAEMLGLELPTVSAEVPVAAAVVQEVVPESTPVVETQTQPTVNTNITMGAVVPRKDPNFIRFGSFSTINTVIKSGKCIPTYITGESGNGKTMTVEQACAINNRPLIIFNITNETTEEDLMGRMTLVDGNTVWQDGPVLQAYRTGAVLCLDEIDQGTSRIMCLQTILQNKPYFIKLTNETVMPAPGFNVIATANTRGRGDDGDKYIGAQIMNDAFLERFPITVEQEYPEAKVEKKILMKICSDEELVNSLVAWAQQIREAEKKNITEHVITTRRLVQVIENYNLFGKVKPAIELAIARFDFETRETFYKMFTTISSADQGTADTEV